MPSTVMPRRAPQLLTERAGADVIVFDRETNVAVSLNAVGGEVLAWCDGAVARDHVATQMQLGTAELQNVLDDLESAGLLARDGISRRSALRSAALAGGIVLATLTAPTAMAAASVTVGQVSVPVDPPAGPQNVTSPTRTVMATQKSGTTTSCTAPVVYTVLVTGFAPGRANASMSAVSRATNVSLPAGLPDVATGSAEFTVAADGTGSVEVSITPKPGQQFVSPQVPNVSVSQAGAPTTGTANPLTCA